MDSKHETNFNKLSEMFVLTSFSKNFLYTHPCRTTKQMSLWKGCKNFSKT